MGLCVCTGKKAVLQETRQETSGSRQGLMPPSRALEGSREQWTWHKGCRERHPRDTHKAPKNIPDSTQGSQWSDKCT